MKTPHPHGTATDPDVQVERTPLGVRLSSPRLLVWEPTLEEAIAQRDGLEDAPAAAGVDRTPSRLVYGPVASRRFGRSLGIDLMPPGRHVCSFDCVYCELPLGEEDGGGRSWPTPGDVECALGNSLPDAGPLDSITISGRGEPTLHPRFGSLAAAVLCTARRARPEVPVRILTNGSRATRPEVRRALDLLDECVVKLDADSARIARPRATAQLGTLVAGLALLREVTVQACFVSGEPSNVGPEAVEAWIELLREIRPRAVQIYTIDRPPRVAGVRSAPLATLEAIASLLRLRIEAEVRVFA
jgi:wyosine [tRNA(Phe)-imidazoG37] synthetase (radical SAM superfamily)